MTTKKRTTLRDVAAAMGVSVGTVSRALANSDRVHPKTRERIQYAAKAMDYSVNIAAQGIRLKRSRLIGVIVPNLHNPTFTRFAAALQADLQDAGYEMVLCVTESVESKEIKAIHLMIGHQADGIIIIGSQFYHPISVDEDDVPIVYLFRAPKDGEHRAIFVDDLASTREVIAHLASLGHERIAFVSGPSPAGLEGYQAGHREAGLRLVPELLKIGQYSPAFGAQAISRLMLGPVRPTAVILAAHPIWEGGLPRIGELGIKIPDELSVVCREYSPQLEWWNPPISSINTDEPALARLARDELLRRMGQDRRLRATGPLRIPAQLVLRRSTARPTTVVRAG